MRMQAWEVYIPKCHGDWELIDTVFFSPNCNKEYVLDSLIRHDNYPYNIVIYKG